MTREELEKVFENDSTNWSGDNALQGLIILNKYTQGKMVLEGADHDIIYSMGIDNVLKNGLTKEDAEQLRQLNWMLDSDCDCFSCFV